MVTIAAARKLAMAFEEATEEAHFERTSFRVRKKIFATMDIEKNLVVVKLSLIDQQVFAGFDKKAVYPVPGAWGTKGWTIIELTKVSKELFGDALRTSYCGVAPKKLAAKYREE